MSDSTFAPPFVHKSRGAKLEVQSAASPLNANSEEWDDDKGGRKRMFIGSTGEDTPAVILYAPDGELARAMLLLNTDNSVMFKLYGRSGKDLVSLGSATDGTGLFQLCGPSGTPRATILAPEKGSPAGLRLYDSNGKQRLLVGTNEKDEPVVRFLDADGKVLKELNGAGK